jgi:hypothetical protein
MKKQLILVLTISALALTSCEEVDVPRTTTQRQVPPLSITSFYPASSPGGTEIMISGQNFGTTKANNYVSFNGNYAEVTQVQLGLIMVLVPRNLSPGDYTISITAHGQTTSSERPFRITNF